VIELFNGQSSPTIFEEEKSLGGFSVRGKQTKLAVLSLLLGMTAVTGACSTKEQPAANSPAADKAQSKKFKISLFNPGVNADAPHVPREQDPIGQMIEKKMNVELEMIIVPEQAPAKLNAMIASGDVPDLITTNRNDAVKFYEQGIITDLDSLLQKTPALQQLYDKARWQKSTYKGKIIGIPNDQPTAGQHGYWVRNDWLQKLGLKQPTTSDELLEVMRAFTFKDPDGNGKNDTYGFVGGLAKDGTFYSGTNQLFLMFGVYPNHIDVVNNKLVYSNTDPKMKDALAYMKKIIDEKLIDPDWVTVSDFVKTEDKMYRGKSGILVFDWRRGKEPQFQALMKAASGEIPDWITIAPPKGPYGDQFVNLDPTYSSVWGVSKKAAADPEKAQRIIELLQYMYTDKEIYPHMSYGLKDIMWKEENGKIVVTPNADAQETRWARHWRFPRTSDDPVYFGANNPKTLEYWALNKKYSKPNPAVPVLIPDPSDTLAADRIKYMNEMLLKFATGKEPLANWDTYVQTLKTKFKLDALLDNYTQQLKAEGILK
jgi:putative aldouronate transport system substrate-binding protein